MKSGAAANHAGQRRAPAYPLHQTGPAAFPETFRGDAFVALHGSWNRALRTGYKVIRLKLHDGVPTGAYKDFLTGFVTHDRKVWGRPVGVAVAHDGALLISEDGDQTIWRIAYTGGAKPSARRAAAPAGLTAVEQAE